MKSASYYRDLCDEDLLIAGREMSHPNYPPSYTEALLERFESALHDISVLVVQRDALIQKQKEDTE